LLFNLGYNDTKLQISHNSQTQVQCSDGILQCVTIRPTAHNSLQTRLTCAPTRMGDTYGGLMHFARTVKFHTNNI